MVDFYNHNIIVDYINNIKEDEENDIKQEKYQKMFLECLYFEEYNDTEVGDRIDSIYNIVKNNDCIKKYCEKMQKIVPILSLMTNVEKKAPNAFIFLFAYDYFEFFHLCLVDLFNTGNITHENNENIIKKLDCYNI